MSPKVKLVILGVLSALAGYASSDFQIIIESLRSFVSMK